MESFLRVLKFVLGIPFALSVVWWILQSVANPSPEKIAEGGELVAQSAIPWWIPVVQALAWVGGSVGGILIIVFLFYVFRTKLD